MEAIATSYKGITTSSDAHSLLVASSCSTVPPPTRDIPRFPRDIPKTSTATKDFKQIVHRVNLPSRLQELQCQDFGELEVSHTWLGGEDLGCPEGPEFNPLQPTSKRSLEEMEPTSDGLQPIY